MPTLYKITPRILRIEKFMARMFRHNKQYFLHGRIPKCIRARLNKYLPEVSAAWNEAWNQGVYIGPDEKLASVEGYPQVENRLNRLMVRIRLALGKE